MEIIVKNRADWVNSYNLYPCIFFFEIFTCPADSSTCSYTGYEIINFLLHLLPDFRPCGVIMSLIVFPVIMLVREIAIWCLLGQSRGDFIVALRRFRWQGMVDH